MSSTRWGGGTAWSVRLPVTEKIAGSNPVRPASWENANFMEKLITILKDKLSHEHLDLEKEKLDVFQFPIFKDGTQIDFALLEAGTSHPPHIHEDGSSHLYVIIGTGKLILGNQQMNYVSGQVFDVPKGTRHGFDVIEDTVLLSIQDKPILNEGKLDFRYDR